MDGEDDDGGGGVGNSRLANPEMNISEYFHYNIKLLLVFFYFFASFYFRPFLFTQSYLEGVLA